MASESIKSREEKIIARHTFISAGLLFSVVPALIWIGAIWQQVQVNTQAIKEVSTMRLTFDKRLSDRLRNVTKEMYELKGQMIQLNSRLEIFLEAMMKDRDRK